MKPEAKAFIDYVLSRPGAMEVLRNIAPPQPSEAHAKFREWIRPPGIQPVSEEKQRAQLGRMRQIFLEANPHLRGPKEKIEMTHVELRELAYKCLAKAFNGEDVPVHVVQAAASIALSVDPNRV